MKLVRIIRLLLAVVIIAFLAFFKAKSGDVTFSTPAPTLAIGN